MEVLRDNIRNSENMQSEIREDMQMISELNARAATSRDPALSAMYMTLASELSESVKYRMEAGIDAKLMNALGQRGSPDIDGKILSNIEGNQNLPSSNSANIRYAVKIENGKIVEGQEIIDVIRSELWSKVYSDNKSRLSEEKDFAQDVKRKLEKDEKRHNPNKDLDIDEEYENHTVYSRFYSYRYNMSSFIERAEDNHHPEVLYERILLDRCDNIRNISRAVLNGDEILSSKDRNDINDPSYKEIKNVTLAYLMEKTVNALDLATEGKSADKSLSRLDNSQLSLLKKTIKEFDPKYAVNRDEYYEFYHSVVYCSRFDDLIKKNQKSNDNSIEEPVNKNDSLVTENGAIGMCIANDETSEIHASEFIDKINSGKPLTEAEKNWACSQFDNMAKRSGADIRGMYVNGVPVFDPDFYGKEGYEDKAKCVLIASALEGKRIATVPVKNGFPESGNEPVPVKVVDITEPTLSLWERILEFFGLGRGSDIRKANDLTRSSRSSDAEKIADDLKNNETIRTQNTYVRGKTYDFGNGMSEAAEQNTMSESRRLKEMMETALKQSSETMVKNEREFFGSYYEKVEKGIQSGDIKNVSKEDITLNAGIMVEKDLTYTNEIGTGSLMMATLHRVASRTHMLYLYGMTEKGYSLEEMMHSKDIDRKAIGDEFMEKFSMKNLDEFAKEKNLAADSPEARKSYNEYVLDKKQQIMSLSNRMFETLKKQEYIAADPNDPESCIKNYDLISNYFGMVCDFVQVFSPMHENSLNPSDPSAKPETDRTSAINNYQYYNIMPLQSYYTAYSKYIDFLSSDSMLSKDDDGTLLDMAARSKSFLENVKDWTDGKKTWGEIIADRKLANEINSCGAACVGDDENYRSDTMNDINFAYLHSTDKNFHYITIDPSRAAFKRLGVETSNESLCQENQTDYENAEKEAAKYLPEGFTKNLDEAYTKMIAQEKEANKAPVREKMDFNELLGDSPKHVVKSVAPNEKQLDKEKSMGAMSAK